MFAKVFGQIFDSSIAEDYNCRRMFMDLLVLSDPTGAVDMTHEAIARRTNVPIDEVRKYLDQLSQPDPASRSQLEQGKRLTLLDSNRDWGWQIVNYQHYRKLKDQEALRSYFRDAQRKYRLSKKSVKDNGLTDFNGVERSLTPSSTSSSVSSSTFLEELKRNPFNSGVDINGELEKAQRWCKNKGRRCTQRFFTKWVERADRLVPDLKPSRTKYVEMLPVPEMTPEELARRKTIAAQEMKALRDKFRMPTPVPEGKNGIQ